MEARFNKYVGAPNDAGCMLWTGYACARTPNYSVPYFNIGNQRPESAYRVAYRLAKGEIPTGLQIRHTCDNSLCVNPDHLVLGTHRDNMRDMAERDRRKGIAAVKGEKHGQSKLTAEQVREIRSSTETRDAIAKRMGVSPSTIKGIRTGRLWKHLSQEE